ncbi:13725_t:CDS:2, partial [Cetraspora pellucida]
MPCYADTIVRVKVVRQTTKHESDLIIVWAIGVYPVGREDSEIEMVLFAPINYSDRDPETQAIFEKDGFYSVGGKIVPGYYGSNKRPKSNKCPLKISLIGIPQELPKVVENDENAIFNVLVNDYVGQDYSFIVKVAFLHSNPRLGHLKSTVRPHDSLIFVVGQLEVIDNDFYIYAKDINFVDLSYFKRKSLDESNLRNPSEVVNVTRSKLLFTHRKVNENLKDISKVEGPSVVVSNDNLSSMSSTSKRARIEDDNEFNESTDVFGNIDSNYSKLSKINSSNEVYQHDESESELEQEECAENIE